MIVDDLWREPFVRASLGEHLPHIVRVPFHIDRENYYHDPLVDKLCPPTINKTLDASWARAPHAVTALIGFSEDPGAIFVRRYAAETKYKTGLLGGVEDWDVLSLHCDADGWRYKFFVVRLIRDESRMYLVGNFSEEERDPGSVFGPSADVWTARIVLTTFALMNARNIVSEEVRPTQDRASRRRGDLPPFTYHVLKVLPLAELQRTSRDGGQGHALPIHWIRGHFKSFSAERPLFGKYSGRFWWQPTLHG